MQTIKLSDIHEHDLVYTNRSEWLCNICQRTYYDCYSFYCSACEFSYCQCCYALKTFVVHPHPLSPTHKEKWTCDICSKSYNDENSYCCEKCEFNCCEICQSEISKITGIHDEAEKLRKFIEDENRRKNEVFERLSRESQNLFNIIAELKKEEEEMKKKKEEQDIEIEKTGQKNVKEETRAVNVGKCFTKKEKKRIKSFYPDVLKRFSAQNKKQIMAKKEKIEEQLNNFTHFQKKISEKAYRRLFINKINKIIKNSKLLEQEQKLSHLNIYVMGKIGVGKSTLINSVLNLKNKNAAEEGKGGLTTKKCGIYTSPSIPWLRLYDSKGIQISDYGKGKIFERAKKKIEASLKSKNPDEHIHAIWYCVTGDRFEKSEKEAIEALMSIYNNSNFPVIIVYTQAYFKNRTNKMIEAIKEAFIGKSNDLNFCSVVAKDYIDEDDDEYDKKESIKFKARGLNELMKITKEKSNEFVKSSFYNSLITLVTSRCNKIIAKKKEFLSKKFENTVEKKVSRLLTRTCCFHERALEYLLDLVGECILCFLRGFNNGIYELEKKDARVIKAYINGSFKKFICEEFLEYKNNFIEKELRPGYANMIMDIELIICKKFKINMPNLKTRKRIYTEIEDYINDRIRKKIDCIVIKEILFIFGNKFIEKFGDCLFASFNSVLEGMKNNLRKKAYSVVEKTVIRFS